MKKLALIAGLIILTVLSCKRIETPEETITAVEPQSEEVSLVFRAVIGDASNTKTAVQSDERSIYWTAGDAINLFYGGRSSGQFTTNITEPAAMAEFYGTLGVVTGTTEAGAEAQAFWGVYPYNAANTCNGTGVVLTIPGDQSGVAGTFADNLNPTVAKSTSLDLAFYNVGSWFIFSVTQENVVSATFKGNASESIAGTMKVTMDENERPVSQVQSGIASITMTPSGGGSFAVGQKYYMVVIPQTLAEGYSLTLTKADGSSAEVVVSGSKTFTRSQYRTKLNADNGLTYHREGNIDFADAAVKAICVERWDTDGDGELSYDEAAAVTSIPYAAFAENRTITSFDEFQFFTGVTNLGYDSDYDEGMDYYGTFYNCTALKSIVLPPTLRTITYGCFRDCSALEEIVIPQSVTTIQQVAFLGCENLSVILESETPCSLQKDTYGTYDEPYVFGFLTSGKVKAIYVPTEECVDTYKNAQYWFTYRSRIKWIGDKPTPAPEHEYVNLGLTSGLKWATCNVGASAPEEYGDYFAWGETEPYYTSGHSQDSPCISWENNKTGYDWASYKWCNGSYSALTRYNSDSSRGTVDNKTEFSDYNYVDDAARQTLGGTWRTPTDAEWIELRTECTWIWTIQNGINGYLVTGPNDNSIFLPAAGQRIYVSIYDAGSFGDYWSSSVYSDLPNYAYYAWNVRFDSASIYGGGSDYRYYGKSVRPVTE